MNLLTEEEIYDLYFKSSLELNQHFSVEQHKNFALKNQKKGLLLDKERIRELEKFFFDNFNKRFGVLSLTAIRDNVTMWDYYANHNKGFCIGFHSIALCKTSNLFGGGGIMNYYNVLPIIKFTDQNEKKYYIHSSFTGVIYFNAIGSNSDHSNSSDNKFRRHSMDDSCHCFRIADDTTRISLILRWFSSS